MENNTRSIKIALLAYILPLIDERRFGGGGTLVEKGLVEELLSLWGNIYLIPKLTIIYSILENKNVIQDLLNSKIETES